MEIQTNDGVMVVSEIKNFDAKTEAKLIKAISKVKDYAKIPLSIEQALSMDCLGFLDPSQIMFIEARSEEAKRILYKFINTEDSINHARMIEGIKDRYGKEQLGYGCTYANKYLLMALKILDAMNEKVGYAKITSGQMMPSILENKHFRIIIAPCDSETI